MAECYQGIQKCISIVVQGGTEPCTTGERRFVTLHFHPFEIRSPSTNRCFWGRLQIMHKKTRGCGASSSEQEGDSSDHIAVEPQREEWWKSTLRQCATAMPKMLRRARLLEEECEALVTKWFQRKVETGGGGRDFSNMSVLQWW